MADHLGVDDDARLDRPVEPHRGEVLAAAAIVRLGKHAQQQPRFKRNDRVNRMVDNLKRLGLPD